MPDDVLSTCEILVVITQCHERQGVPMAEDGAMSTPQKWQTPQTCHAIFGGARFRLRVHSGMGASICREESRILQSKLAEMAPSVLLMKRICTNRRHSLKNGNRTCDPCQAMWHRLSASPQSDDHSAPLSTQPLLLAPNMRVLSCSPSSTPPMAISTATGRKRRQIARAISAKAERSAAT